MSRVLWPTGTRFTSNFCLIVFFILVKNNLNWLNLWKFRICSFGIGCWVRWARYEPFLCFIRYFKFNTYILHPCRGWWNRGRKKIGIASNNRLGIICPHGRYRVNRSAKNWGTPGTFGSAITANWAYSHCFYKYKISWILQKG